jgi:hypothetical protein
MGLLCPPKQVIMISFVDVALKAIFSQGRNFLWQRPAKCLRCANWKVWGHGHVQRNFEGFSVPLWLKRYRCPECHCIIQMRPTSHFSRFQSSRNAIHSALVERIIRGKWPPGHSGRMRHWLRNLRRQIRVHLTEKWKSGLLKGFDRLVTMGRVPISRSI